MTPKTRPAIHPGVILSEEFLKPLGIRQTALAKHLGVTDMYISDLICGRRSLNPTLMWHLSQAFGTSPEFWMNLQAMYNLAKNKPRRKVKRIKKENSHVE